MKKIFHKGFILLFTLVFTLQLISCGTILYPERRGTTSGQLDPLVVGLDAIGIVFFLIPGIIAFAVDYSTGAIYMSGGKRASIGDGENADIVTIKVDADDLSLAKIQSIIKEYKNIDVDLHGKDVTAIEMKDVESVKAGILTLNNFGYYSSNPLIVMH